MIFHLFRRARGITWLPALLVTGLGFNASVVCAAPMDPLSPEEMQRTKQAMSSFMHRSSSNHRLRQLAVTGDAAGSTSTLGVSERVETLLVETLDPAKGAPANTPKKAVAYVYDYETDQLTRLEVDPQTGASRVLAVEQGVQLPLTDSEVATALDLAFSDSETREQLDAQFEQITGEALHSTSQLYVKAFTFHADTAPGNLLPASESCGQQRCAQLMLYTHDKTAFEFMPIVNLSEQLVTELMGVNP
ncbi:MAG: hypothetical protein ACWA5X_02160 [bacterium]